jgi:hypothetical protein
MSSVEVVERAFEKKSQASLVTPMNTSTACPPFDPEKWPLALRSQEAADLFRKRAYQAARLPPPSEQTLESIPKQITVVSAATGEEVVNKVGAHCLCVTCVINTCRTCVVHCSTAGVLLPCSHILGLACRRHAEATIHNESLGEPLKAHDIIDQSESG